MSPGWRADGLSRLRMGGARGEVKGGWGYPSVPPALPLEGVVHPLSPRHQQASTGPAAPPGGHALPQSQSSLQVPVILTL